MWDKRGSSLIQRLLKNPSITTIELSELSNLSKRQVTYALQKINDKLKTLALPEIQRDKKGHFIIDDVTRQWLVKHLSKNSLEINQEQHILSFAMDYYDEYSRRNMLLIMMIAHCEDMHLENLQSKLCVSKNTILNDLKKISLYLNDGLSIAHSRLSGYGLVGDEWLILQLLLRVLNNEEKVANGEYILNQLKGYGRRKVVHLISCFESDLNIAYSDSALNFLIHALRFSLIRMKRTPRDASYFRGKVSDTREFNYLKSIFVKQKIEFNDSDLSWITLLFLTANTLRNGSANTDTDLICAIDRMISLFENQTYMTIRNRQDFSSRLLKHLRPVIFRIRYNLPLNGFDFSHVVQDKDQNRLLISMIKRCIDPVEKLIGKQIPPDEMQLIAFYFGTELENYGRGQRNKPRAVVVCSNGLVVAKLMFDNLKRIFPEINFVTTAAVRDFNVYQADYDLVFTTVPLKTNISQYIIEPMLTMSEQLKLRLRVLRDLGIQNIGDEVIDVMQIIQRHALINEKGHLKAELSDYFARMPYERNMNSLHSSSTDELPDLTYYVKRQYIQFIDQPLEWEKATRFACQPLINNKVIEPRYADYIIKQINNPQSYSFLQEKIAIPHALPEMGSLSDGFGFLVCHHEIRFPGHDGVIIIVPISITSINQHLRAVNQLVKLATDDLLLNKICTTASTKYVRQLLAAL
jgi:transcriptional antiterminator/mannitol/fructose-specific phosphotransferase system IIA component (Ntr-type)